MFTGLAVIYIAEKMTQNNENWMLQVSRKRNIKNNLQDASGVLVEVVKWFKLNKDKDKVMAITSLCFLFGVFFGLVFLGQTAGVSMDMTLSTLTTCGYQGLPESASYWQYVVIAVYTNLAVPVFTISLGECSCLPAFLRPYISLYSHHIIDVLRTIVLSCLPRPWSLSLCRHPGEHLHGEPRGEGLLHQGGGAHHRDRAQVHDDFRHR
jgi:hypothetical protein